MSQQLGEPTPILPMRPVEYVIDGIHIFLILMWVYLAICAAGWLPPAPYFHFLIPPAGSPHIYVLYVAAAVAVLDYPMLMISLKRAAQKATQAGGQSLVERVAMRAAFAAAPVVYFIAFYLMVRN